MVKKTIHGTQENMMGEPNTCVMQRAIVNGTMRKRRESCCERIVPVKRMKTNSNQEIIVSSSENLRRTDVPKSILTASYTRRRIISRTARMNIDAKLYTKYIDVINNEEATSNQHSGDVKLNKQITRTRRQLDGIKFFQANTLSTSINASPLLAKDSFSLCSSDRIAADRIREKFQSMIHKTRLDPNFKRIRFLTTEDFIPCQGDPFLLGIGSFSQVSRVSIIEDGTKRTQYACKQLKPELYADTKNFITAATELAYEAHILASLDHPNIISLRGIHKDGVFSFQRRSLRLQDRQRSSSKGSFFLILDLLKETLDQRIERWRTTDRPRTRVQRHQRNIEKLSICKQLAAVLEYIHSRGVVYRDLKPENIGFCQEKGNLKLFDFGLCRELPFDTSKADDRKVFRFSGMVGTMRYMAPEVCLSQPYNRDCDIYSWGIIAWEILSQAKPFQTLTPTLYTTLVCERGMRPTDFPLKMPRESNHEAINHEHGEDKSSDSITPIPCEIQFVLKQAWKAQHNQRIRLPKIQDHLALFLELEELRLEEEKLHQFEL